MKRKPISHLNRKQLGHLFATITDKDDSAIGGSCDQAIRQEESGEQSKPIGASLLEQSGTWIGRYKLLDVLGEGGMGVVYLAEQEQPIKRQVALKVVKPGMDSKRVIARFESERQALALLNHPSIAHVYDAGTTEGGRPYFVMELVTGVSITDYCDQHKLTIEERLELFLLVCDAVQYAHQKGIIHRDIKSSNILISLDDDNAVPKIIDFGIAKALTALLTERTLCTEQGELIGTPEYMSPEQAKMTSEGVDTRTDIYSLGVVLYKLLTGVLPFNAKTLRQGGIENIRQVIREEDPKTPSTRLSMASGEESTKLAKLRRTDVRTLRQKLHGDLDWITLKAMEKEPDLRYATAHALAEDIRCYLNHQPVTARSPTIAYRLRKFVRRNRIQVIAAVVAVVLAFCIGVLTVTYSRASRQARAAAALRDRETLQTAQEAFSERRFAEALELVGFIVGSEHVGSQARLLQANILLEGGHQREAEEMLSSLIHDTSEIAGAAHALLARIYWENSDSQTGSLEQAAYHRKEAERLLPETADAFYLGALTALTVKETMQMLEKALTLDPRHYPSRRLHACTLWASQRYLEMETDALALIVSRPKDSFGYFLSATARFEQKKYEPALQDIERALQLTPEETARRSELLDLRCRIHMALGKYQRVVSDADSCLQEFPDKTVFSFHKFCAHLGLGQYDEARTVFHGIAENNDQAKQELINWSMKYVFETLAAGRNWHKLGQRPEGAPFIHMNEAEANYKEYASKGRRLISKGYAASWSPDGTKLAYSSGAIGVSGVALYDFRTGQSELLIVPGKDPRWSPDGRHIAFVRGRQSLDMAALASVGHLRLGQRRMEEEVWVMRSDGTEARRLALGAWPSWSPDSKHVFYHSRAENALCRIAAHDRTASPQRLWETGWPWPSVSPDGRHVAWIYGDTRLCISNLKELTPRPIHICDFPDLRFYGGRWAPSGRWFSLAGYDPEEQAGLWIYDMIQGQAKKMLSGLAGTAHWSADEKSLVYLVDAPILELWAADIESLGSGKTFAEHDREMAAYYTRMIRAYPKQAQYYLSRASCYIRLNELEKAITDVERAERISDQPEKTASWLAQLKAAYKAGGSVQPDLLAGNMSYDSTTDTYSIVGSGFDIWDVFDEFYFAYARLEGDGSITAKIESVEHVHDWTKAGLMIRNTLDPASENGTVLITPTGRVLFQWRDREMGRTRGTITDRNSIMLPHWVRLTRKGNQFTAQHSSDGVQWDTVVDFQDPNRPTSIEISMNGTVHIGLAVSSHNTWRTAEARISNVTVAGSVTPSGPFTFSQDISFQTLPDSNN
jgi:serine/threonine protein kinase